MTSVTLTFDLWPWPFAWTSLLSLVTTLENFMMIWWGEHSQKGVTDRRTDRQTDGKYHSLSCLVAAKNHDVMCSGWHNDYAHNLPQPMDLHDLHFALSMIHSMTHVCPVLLNKRTVVAFWHRNGYARTRRWEYLTRLSLNHFSSVAVDGKSDFYSPGPVWIMGWSRKSTRYLLRHCRIACAYVRVYYCWILTNPAISSLTFFL